MERVRMRRCGLALSVAVLSAAWIGASSAYADGTRQIPASAITTIQDGALGSADLQWPEFAGQPDGDTGPAPFGGSIVNRSLSHGSANGVSANSGKKAKSNPELGVSFDGLNHFQNRTASGGNQFSLEPPDQGLCAGNGFVLETVNDVLRVFHQDGSTAGPVTALNAFYGYLPSINRRTGIRGPFVTDPSCYFDQQTQRWFHVVLTLEVNPHGGAFLGPNHLDLAVSQTADPTGTWTIYRIPVQDDGSQGTPNHHCAGGPCLGDFPHVGADANGFYITTNEYPFFADGFHAAQVYAFSKAQLASGASSVAVTQIDTVDMVGGNPGFTLWPATTPGDQFDGAHGGTEYFLSSDAADEANGHGVSTDLIVWSLSNTKSLDGGAPSLGMSNTILFSEAYANPPRTSQKAGDFPLGQLVGEPEATFDSSDTRMLTTTYANGKVWGALDTALTIGGKNKAGVAWFVVNPHAGKIDSQGYLGLADNNVTYPAIGVTPSGRGVMAFTVSGDDFFPSAGYAGIDAVAGPGDIHVAAPGLGPDDGFTGYAAFVGSPPRTRWGDYGGATVDGSSVWIASEFIGQTCTLATFVHDSTCGHTRTLFANWGTHISQITP